MYLKWIVCTVPSDQREAFSRAQEAWATIARVHGFMGQVGGWDQNQPEQACILGLWRDAGSYQAFMNQTHDVVTDENSQAKTYTAIQVQLFEDVQWHAAEAATFPDALQCARFLTLSEAVNHHSAQALGFCSVRANANDFSFWEQIRETTNSAANVKLEMKWLVLPKINPL